MIGGHHPVLYFQIQVTEKYSTAMCYDGDYGEDVRLYGNLHILDEKWFEEAFI